MRGVLKREYLVSSLRDDLAYLSYTQFSLQTSDKGSYDTPVNPHKSWLQFQNVASTYDSSSEKANNLFKTKDGKVVVSLSVGHSLNTNNFSPLVSTVSIQFINGKLFSSANVQEDLQDHQDLEEHPVLKLLKLI